MSVRVFLPPATLAAGRLSITGDELHYLSRVRRLRAGDELLVSDGAGREAAARLIALDRDEAVVEVGAIARANGIPPLTIAVAFAPVKGDRSEWAIQKLTELGAHSLHPMQTERSVVVLRGARAETRAARYQAIATEAARQSRAPIVPRVERLAPLAEVIERLAASPLKLAFWEGARGTPLRRALGSTPPKGAAIVIGPEGGLTADEIACAEAAGFSPVGLGPRILRAETAAIAAVAAIQHALGDLG